jgi:HrpA-like RNA helicase
MAMNDDINNSGVVEEWCRTGGGEVADTARRSEHSAARPCLPTSLHRERIARAMHENGVVILTGLTGSGKSTQVP